MGAVQAQSELGQPGPHPAGAWLRAGAVQAGGTVRFGNHQFWRTES
jgi:hypothetical protein